MTLPSALLLLGALGSAMILASRSRGWKLWIVAAFDALFALNHLLSRLQPGNRGDMPFGEHSTIGGSQALRIMAILFVGGPALGAWWSGRRALRTAAEAASRRGSIRKARPIDRLEAEQDRVRHERDAAGSGHLRRQVAPVPRLRRPLGGSFDA